jgi:hypothetical protein
VSELPTRNPMVFYVRVTSDLSHYCNKLQSQDVQQYTACIIHDCSHGVCTSIYGVLGTAGISASCLPASLSMYFFEDVQQYTACSIHRCSHGVCTPIYGARRIAGENDCWLRPASMKMYFPNRCTAVHSPHHSSLQSRSLYFCRRRARGSRGG